MKEIEVKMDPTSGMKGLKQISKALHSRRNVNDDEKEEIFEKHSAHFLERCFPDWKDRKR